MKLKQYEWSKEMHNSIFSTKNKIELGPGEYYDSISYN